MTHIGHSEKVLLMRIFLTVLILTFSLQSLTKADDIRDFQIEGISIGDSLLDYLSKEKIINIEKTNYPRSKKFYSISILANSILATSNIYDQFTFAIKQDDKKYIIYALSGDIRFKDGLKGCLKQKKEIVKQFYK